MTPAAVSMKCLTARPDLGATLAYVFGGIAIAKSVGTTAFPLAGTTVSAELQAHADQFACHSRGVLQRLFVYLDKSYPAALAEPRFGRVACGLRNLT